MTSDKEKEDFINSVLSEEYQTSSTSKVLEPTPPPLENTETKIQLYDKDTGEWVEPSNKWRPSQNAYHEIRLMNCPVDKIWLSDSTFWCGNGSHYPRKPDTTKWEFTLDLVDADGKEYTEVHLNNQFKNPYRFCCNSVADDL
jgi:hypothetical protein